MCVLPCLCSVGLLYFVVVLAILYVKRMLHLIMFEFIFRRAVASKIILFSKKNRSLSFEVNTNLRTLRKCKLQLLSFFDIVWVVFGRGGVLSEGFLHLNSLGGGCAY